MNFTLIPNPLLLPSLKAPPISTETTAIVDRQVYDDLTEFYTFQDLKQTKGYSKKPVAELVQNLWEGNSAKRLAVALDLLAFVNAAENECDSVPRRLEIIALRSKELLTLDGFVVIFENLKIIVNCFDPNSAIVSAMVLEVSVYLSLLHNLLCFDSQCVPMDLMPYLASLLIAHSDATVFPVNKTLSLRISKSSKDPLHQYSSQDYTDYAYSLSTRYPSFYIPYTGKASASAQKQASMNLSTYPLAILPKAISESLEIYKRQTYRSRRDREIEEFRLGHVVCQGVYEELGSVMPALVTALVRLLFYINISTDSTTSGDFGRSKEITTNRIASLLLMLLQSGKRFHTLAFEDVVGLMMENNVPILILKMLSSWYSGRVADEKESHSAHGFFKGGDRRSDMGTTTILLRILQKISKRRHSMLSTLVNWKSSAVLKRVLKVRQCKYALKLLASQIPFLGKKWRLANMQVISGIFLQGLSFSYEEELDISLESSVKEMSKSFRERFRVSTDTDIEGAMDVEIELDYDDIESLPDVIDEMPATW